VTISDLIKTILITDQEIESGKVPDTKTVLARAKIHRKIRRCLRCGRIFESAGPGNRIYGSCQHYTNHAPLRAGESI
jgi:hypothetical protein